MRYASALKALEARQETRIELGLDRVRAHLARLGDPHKGLPCFHVAGTNGKGSVCAMLDSVLRRAGLRTGLYISPHLETVRERIRVDGRPIPEAAFAQTLERTLKADPQKRLTYFEILTSMAFQWFSEQNCQAVVLETGLGGRLDATNVVERPLAAVLTSVSLDHTQHLGETVRAIAAEKAGIFKADSPALAAALAPEALSVARAAAKKAGARFSVVRTPYKTVSTDWKEQRQVLAGPKGARLSVGLLGKHQGMNAALVRAALDAAKDWLPVDEEAFRTGLEAVLWPGRFEVLRLGNRTAVLDGAHNPEAAARLRETWAASPWARQRAVWVLGVLRDKDAAGIIRALAPGLREVVAVAPPSPRALPAPELAALVRREAPGARVSVASGWRAALSAWRRGDAPAAVFAGSFYLVGQALSELRRDERDA